MRAAAIIVVGISNQYPAQMIFTHDDYMIEALPADSPNCPLGIYVLPRRLLSRDVLTNAQFIDAFGKFATIATVTVPNQIVWPWIFREGLCYLTSEPVLCGMLRSANVQDFSAIKLKDDESEEYLKRHRNDDEHVDSGRVLHMIL